VPTALSTIQEKEMQDAAAGCQSLDGLALVRARAVERYAKAPARAFDAEAGWARFQQLMGA
jgi:hypothetical protein